MNAAEPLHPIAISTATATASDLYPHPINPFSPRVRGLYIDDLVVVGHRDVHRPDGATRIIARTPSFDVWRDSALHIAHRIGDASIDDSLTGRIDAELFAPGWLSGNDLFERVFTGLILSARQDPLDAWELFYRNTRMRLAASLDGRGVADIVEGLDEFAEIYRHVDRLVPTTGSVLEIGSCFGFLALHLASRHHRRVTASDVSTSTMSLLGALAPRLGICLSTTTLDARTLACPDASYDTVVLVHLLEHLDDVEGRKALDEARRVARRTIIVAVPYEEVATASYGHVRTIRRDDLEQWALQDPRWRGRVEDFRGGWLVLDRAGTTGAELYES